MQINNPILSGFYPDPSICRVEDTFYLVTSSFEYFPSIPIFESKNLIDWHQIGHALTEDNALTLLKGHPNKAGIYAPTIRYHEGLFYIVCTNVAYDGKDNGNFIVTAPTANGPWSKPVFLNLPGIDPSLFFDDDGSVYYTGTHGAIYTCKINPLTGEALEARTKVWNGTGGCAPEGPHLYKKSGWYYLMISEGGTEMGHMVTIARSKSPYGPFESYENNPILTNRSTEMPIRATGHADLVCDTNGNWWAVCLGVRVISYPLRHNLGRETCLMPVDWSGEWPIMGNKGRLEEKFDLDLIVTNDLHEEKVAKNENKAYEPMKMFFNDNQWNTLYELDRAAVNVGLTGLELFGQANTLSEVDPKAWYGVRQRHHLCEVETTLLSNTVSDKSEAGVTIYLNNRHHYEIGVQNHDAQKKLILRRQIGSLFKIENEMLIASELIGLKITATLQDYIFSYKLDQDWIEFGRGETQYLTTEVGGCFTGNYFALYALSENSTVSPSIFKNFFYRINLD